MIGVPIPDSGGISRILAASWSSIVTRPSWFIATTPSLIDSNIALRSLNKRAISEGSRPKIERLTSIEINQVPIPPSKKRPHTHNKTRCKWPSVTLSTVSCKYPTETTPITLPASSNIGTLPRIDGPSVPTALETYASPFSRARGLSPPTINFPIRSGTG